MFAGTAFSVAVLVFLQAFLNGVTDDAIDRACRMGHGHVAAWWQFDDNPSLAVLDQARTLPHVARRRCAPHAGVF